MCNVEACEEDMSVGRAGIIAGSADMCARVERLTSGWNCTKILVGGESKWWTRALGVDSCA